MMKNPEEAIEKVLAGLRSSDAPIGMERRILESLQNQASVRSRSGWRRWSIVPMHPAAIRSMKWCVALAAAFAVVFAITVNRWVAHVSAPSKRISAPIASLPPAVANVAAKSTHLPPLGPSVQSVKTSNPGGKVNPRRVEVVRDGDSLAMDEMRAASHPPPPMPLTEQERLLLRIAHKGDPVEFAELNPMERAARYAEEKAEVRRFFIPVKTGDNE